ncbi:MAG: hypothetical protein U0992_17745 [Planctomycetaceae bacterium]
MSRFSIPRPSAPLLIAVLATAAVIGTIDPAGSYPELGEGPGITLDEHFNVDMGVYQWHALREHGWRLWTPEVRDKVFASGAPRKPYNPDHPPLGRLWLGIWHDIARWLWSPVETGAQRVTACARVGSAMAFGITVWLIGTFAGQLVRLDGRLVGGAVLCTDAAGLRSRPSGSAGDVHEPGIPGADSVRRPEVGRDESGRWSASAAAS